MTSDNIPSDIRRKCHDRAFHSFGTACIIERRARRLNRIIKTKFFLEIATPVAAGFIIFNFQTGASVNAYLAYAVVLIGFGLLMLSILAAVNGWHSNLVSYIDSKVSNYKLSREFTDLGNVTNLTLHEFENQLRLLEVETTLRDNLDQRWDYSGLENRTGVSRTIQDKTGGQSEDI